MDIKIKTAVKKISLLFVKYVYADHNSSHQVKQAIKKCLKKLNNQDKILNVGSGETRIHPNVINLDIYPGDLVDVVGSAEKLPFDNNTFKLLVSQETIEHVKDPFRAVKEMYRVLIVNGIIYLQVPFIIGYHPGPADYWRFTKEGIKELVEQAGFVVEELGVTVGPATGFYRILVEFLAILFSFSIPYLYKAFKGFFALLFYFIKLLDIFFIHFKESDRISGGYYIIAKKK